MSNIQALIETVKEENLKGRKLHLDREQYENEMFGHLTQILLKIQEGLFTFFEEEQVRFNEQQADMRAARRAEAERLKESKGAGFATPAKTSGGKDEGVKAVFDLADGAGLLKGLGIGGLVAGLGVAVAGYFTGLIKNMSKLTAGATKMLSTQFAKLFPSTKGLTKPFTDFFTRLKSLATSFGKLFAGTGRVKDFNAFGDFAKTIRNFGEGVRKITGPIKNFFKPLGELAKLFPSGGGKFVEGMKAFGSKMTGIFKVFSKIAVPLTAIIAAVKGIFSTFEEVTDDMGILEKTMVFIKNMIKEIVSGFVTMPLELIKDGISAIAGWLGFDGVQEYLDSFDIDQMFRDSVDSFFSWIDDSINYIGDLFYQAKRKFGIGDVDPEAEARIAAREVSGAEEDLTQANTRVQQAQAEVDAATNVNERKAAEEKLDDAIQVRDSRAEDLTEARASAVERRTAAGLPATPAASSTPAVPAQPAATQPEPAQPQISYPVLDPVTMEVTGTYATAEEATQAAMASGGMIGNPIQVSNVSNQTASGDQISTVSNQTATGDQISTVSNQTATGDQVSTTSNQTATGDQISTTSNQTATGDQISTVSNQTATGDQISAASNQTATGDQVSNVSNQTATGDQVSTTSNQTATGDQISTVSNQTATGDQISTVSNQTATGDQIQSIDTSTGDQLQEVSVTSQRVPERAAPRVEPLSDLTNVTNINQATTAMQAAISSIIPSQAGVDGVLSPADGALSPTSVTGSGLAAMVDGVKNLTSLPVGQASQEVAAAKDKPSVVAMGGSSTSIQNNVSSPNIHNYGGMSARSNDLTAQRLKDNMLA